MCYDVTTKYPVYCVLMDNINGLQLYLLLLYYDFNKCYYYVDDKESLFYCQIKIFSRQMLSHVHCFFCFPWGFGVNLHVNISLFRITIYFCRGLKFSDLLNEVFEHWMTIKLQMPLYGNRNERKNFCF